MSGKEKEKHIVSVSHLARLAGYTHHVRLMQNLNEEIDTLTEDEKANLSNILYAEIAKTFKTLGFKLSPPARIRN